MHIVAMEKWMGRHWVEKVSSVCYCNVQVWRVKNAAYQVNQFEK